MQSLASTPVSATQFLKIRREKKITMELELAEYETSSKTQDGHMENSKWTHRYWRSRRVAASWGRRQDRRLVA